MSEQQLTTYEPDNSLKSSYYKTLKVIFKELIENRWLMYQLFKRDFSAMYRQSFIGFLWIVIMPAINVAIFAMLGNSGIFNYGQLSAPYPVYAVLGISLWQLFANGIMACGNSLSSAGDMIAKINFSKKSLVIASIGKSIITFTVQLGLVALLLLIYKIIPAKTFFLFPIIAIPIIIFTLGLGLVISLLNSFVRDTGNFLSVIVMLGMYGTPVLYAKPETGLLADITLYNPMYYFVSAGRDMILTGTLTEPAGFVYSSLAAVIIFFLGLTAFHLTETRITERI